MSTIFNKEAASKLIENASAKQAADAYEYIGNLGPGEAFRSEKDAMIARLISIDLPKRDKVSNWHSDSYVADLKSIPEADRVRYVVVFDTETTGYGGYVVSIAAILYDMKEDRVIDKQYHLVNPQCAIPKESTEVHGIEDSDVKNEPTFMPVWDKIESTFLQADMVVGQNPLFDLMVLEREFDRANVENPISGMEYFDTMTAGKYEVQAKNEKGRLKDPTLEELANFYGVQTDLEEGYHNALVDTEVTFGVFKAMVVDRLSNVENV